MHIPSEVEIKIELPSQEAVEQIRTLVKRLGFVFIGRLTLDEYYITTKSSPLGGWDFERLRVIDNNRYIFTKKKWKHDKNGQLIRLEEEEEISKDRATEKLESGYLLHFTKVREEYTRENSTDGPSTIEFDTLTKDRRDRFFLECELLTDQDKAFEARERLKQWIEDNLKLDPCHEAPSMLDIIQESF